MANSYVTLNGTNLYDIVLPIELEIKAVGTPLPMANGDGRFAFRAAKRAWKLIAADDATEAQIATLEALAITCMGAGVTFINERGISYTVRCTRAGTQLIETSMDVASGVNTTGAVRYAFTIDLEQI